MKNVTANVLFGDVKGYSSLTNEQLRIFAHQILPLAAQRIENYEFDHVNTWGDGIVISCSSIREICRIGLEMRDLYSNLDWNKYNLPPLDIRLSIHCGEFHQGTDPFTKTGLISGRTIILAARIEPIVLPNRVWLTEAAAVMLISAQENNSSDFCAVDEIGVVNLPKGAGTQKIFLLRRSKESALSQDERSAVIALSEQRNVNTDRDQRPLASSEYEVCVGIVVRDKDVLVVKRQRDSSGLEWMFPSGKRRKVDEEQYVVVKEVKQETGINCICLEKIHTVESHHITGLSCSYFRLRQLDQAEPYNLDTIENTEAKFVPILEALELIGPALTPEVATYLKNAIK